jgi:hypothetical protein
MLRGEAIAWLYGLILFETVRMVEQDLKGSSVDKLHTGKCNLIMFAHSLAHCHIK